MVFAGPTTCMEFSGNEVEGYFFIIYCFNSFFGGRGGQPRSSGLWVPIFDKLPLLPCSRPQHLFFSPSQAVSEAPLWPSIRTLLWSSCARLHKCWLTRSDSPVYLSLALTADRWIPLTHRRKAPGTIRQHYSLFIGPHVIECCSE